MTIQILVVDDDDDLRSLIALSLRDAGYVVAEASDGLSAIEAYHARQPDLVVLDIGLGAMDGLEVCRRLRGFGNVPVVFLTSRDEEVDELVGFAAGGDDYLTKPFSPKLLVARIGSVLRRGGIEVASKTKYSAGPIELDVEAHSCTVSGTAITLTRTEFELLEALMERPNRVIPREELVERVWGAWYGDDHVVEVHLSRLRSKVKKAGGPQVGVAVRGVGYKLGVS